MLKNVPSIEVASLKRYEASTKHTRGSGDDFPGLMPNAGTSIRKERIYQVDDSGPKATLDIRKEVLSLYL